MATVYTCGLTRLIYFSFFNFILIVNIITHLNCFLQFYSSSKVCFTLLQILSKRSFTHIKNKLISTKFHLKLTIMQITYIYIYTYNIHKEKHPVRTGPYGLKPLDHSNRSCHFGQKTQNTPYFPFLSLLLQ